MERFNLHQTERFWLRKLMFTFQTSLFQTALLSFIVEKASQRRCEIAKPKHCQTNPPSIHMVLFKLVKKKLPPVVSCFCVQTRMSLKYFIIHCTVRRALSQVLDVSLEENVNVVSHCPEWALALCDYFMAPRDRALQRKTRKGRWPFEKSVICEKEKPAVSELHVFWACSTFTLA